MLKIAPRLLPFLLWIASATLPPLAADKPPVSPFARWEPEIQAFEKADQTNPPPRGGIVFVGSSSIRKWTTLADDFPGLPVIQRGFGGSQIMDSTHFASRIILPYEPKLVVLYAGDNDLATGRKPGQVLADFKEFVSTIRAQAPGAGIAFVSIKPSPSRWKIADQMRAANRLIAEFCRGDSKLRYIDVFTAMLADDGKPRPELFLGDQLHMNRQGYALWSSIIRPQLKDFGF